MWSSHYCENLDTKIEMDNFISYQNHQGCRHAYRFHMLNKWAPGMWSTLDSTKAVIHLCWFDFLCTKLILLLNSLTMCEIRKLMVFWTGITLLNNLTFLHSPQINSWHKYNTWPHTSTFHCQGQIVMRRFLYEFNYSHEST